MRAFRKTPLLSSIIGELPPHRATNIWIVPKSRPYLLNLVKKGIVPLRMVGAHHRIPMGAVIAYKRDWAPRRRSLDALSAET
jgi:hypothetical protein